ncbi:hypothetical protein [Nocardioides perillae]|uniref:Uncharacterized protein n=1 Tax=Nocardioides perillae TaxID=1119534 RepID=A0A7Y9RW84_9ACTN|nr:hypothetical protein [Nocardioides perillae]NYG55115.1 hypothetical protein [Nocardioides perillae]
MRRLTWTLPLLLVGWALVACTGSTPGGADSPGASDPAGTSGTPGATDNDALLAEVEQALRTRGDFQRLQVGYVDSVDNAGLVVVDGYCTGCDAAALADEAAALVWRSEVAPLRTLRVSVTDTSTGTRARAGGAVAEEQERLTQQYGVRPGSAGE